MNPRNPLVIGAMVAAGLRSGMLAEMEPVPVYGRRLGMILPNHAPRPDLTYFTSEKPMSKRRRRRLRGKGGAK